MKPSLSIAIHGVPGAGKSRLAATSPGPRLFIDAENGSRFVPGKKVKWNPWVEAPPVDDGTWENCLTGAKEWKDAYRIYEWLASGDHPFRSVVIDSMTELQKRLIDDVSGVEQPRQQDWGQILRSGDDFVRRLRDLTADDAAKPLDALIILALTERKNDMYKPAIRGSLSIALPGHVDVIGYLYVDNNDQGEIERRLLIATTPSIEAKDRTDILTQTYGPVIVNPNISEMIEVIRPIFE